MNKIRILLLAAMFFPLSIFAINSGADSFQWSTKLDGTKIEAVATIPANYYLYKDFTTVELKTEKFKSEFVGQTNKYLTYFRENKLEYERDPIGLIICKEKSREEVHYAIGKLKEDIFVAEYKTYLPSEEDIRKKIKKIHEKHVLRT